MKLSWPLAFLIAFLTTAILGVSGGLIIADKAPASFLLIPLSVVLAAGSFGAQMYIQGLMKIPPAPPGTEYRLVSSIPPQATDSMLAGKVAIPPLDVMSVAIPIVSFTVPPLDTASVTTTIEEHEP